MGVLYGSLIAMIIIISFLQKKINKHQEGNKVKNKNEAVKDVVLDLLPIVGTYRAGKRFYKEPNLENGFDFVLSGVSDVLLPFGLWGLKAAKVAKTAEALNKGVTHAKAMKALKQGSKYAQNREKLVLPAIITNIGDAENDILPLFPSNNNK